MGVIVTMTVVVLVCFFVGVGLAGFVEMLGLGLVGVGFGGALVLEVVVGVRLAVGFGELSVFEDVDFDAGDAAAINFFDFEGCA